jgi:UTP--glucose-1-phosphate uridylyltransferase
MLPVIDKPVIQYAVDEAVKAGCDTLIFVTGRSKRAIEDYFDRSPELEYELKAAHRSEALKLVNTIPEHVKCVYERQSTPRGLGHAVSCASALINEDEYFAVLLPDDLIDGTAASGLTQLIKAHEDTRCGVLAVEKVPKKDLHRYGIIKSRGGYSREYIDIESIIEKPHATVAPSNLAVIGRYVLPGTIFRLLESARPGIGGEIQLTDGIEKLLQHQKVFGVKLAGQRFDCGDKTGLLEANLHFGRKRKILRR